MPARIFDDVALPDGSSTSYSPAESMSSSGTESTDTVDVVVSGISCRLPESDNMNEFRDNLMDKVDIVTEDNRRWEPGLHGLPTRNGKLKDISRFDAAFFGVSPKQANLMDPQLRMLLEVTYEAVVDAGVNPQHVKGSKTGVFIGISASESHEAWSAVPDKIEAYTMTGCCRTMFANRLSFFFDFKGPSYVIDTACSSSLMALDQALASIRSGCCDAAVVGGSNLCLKPGTSLQFMKLQMLSPDGACKSFDASDDISGMSLESISEGRNGYVRSEAVVVIYLQKMPDAKRIYCTVVHSKNNSDGNKSQGITFPSGDIQKKLIGDVYSEACLDPLGVSYVEAHGTGTKVGDPQEVNAITDVFCKDRQGPLLIGSVKSNMGHSEPASGLAGISKVIIAMESGLIPPNIHFSEPNPEIAGLTDGRLKVVTKPTLWDGGYAAINSFGFGGSNVHTLLRSNNRKIPEPGNSRDMDRLFLYSSRTKDGLEKIMDAMDKSSDNIELLALLNETACSSPSAMPYRGYKILNANENIQDIQKCGSQQRPVWYCFAGMGTQWHGMGRDMMQFDKFKQSIIKSDTILKQHGICLYDLIMHGDEQTFEGTVNSFVGIAAIQVALVDLLTHIGIKPDGIVGHSVGELGCGYADGSLTMEETILAAYNRGRCIEEAKLPPGAMAAVGLTWQEALEQCPAGVVPACHNAKDTVTISGPVEPVTKFVQELKAKGIFAKTVHSSNVAFHSYYMTEIAPALKAALMRLITPKARTHRWISSSIPEDKWNTGLAQYSSADYHVNNLISPVLFQEALDHIPENAIVIEIAPHCLLQAILKRSLSADCCIVGLMKRNNPSNAHFFMSSIGKCYMNGLNSNPMKLCPPVEFPVPRGTPMISPLINWDHSQVWNVPTVQQFDGQDSDMTRGSVFEIDISPESDDHYLTGHRIDGRIVFPATGYLVLAWKTLAKMEGKLYEKMPVGFENIHIKRATLLSNTGSTKLEVNVAKATGDFEIIESGSLAASGRVYIPTEPVIDSRPYDSILATPQDSVQHDLTNGDVYKELRLRGYEYGKTFQGIISAGNGGGDGELLWQDNWIPFLDTMLQLQILCQPGKGLMLPTRIKSVKIDPELHEQNIYQMQNEQRAAHIQIYKYIDTCTAGGVEIRGLHATVAPRKLHTHPVLERFQFVPYNEQDVLHGSDIDLYVNTCMAYSTEILKQSVVQSNLNDGHTQKVSHCQHIGSVRSDCEKYLGHLDCSLLTRLNTILAANDTDHSKANPLDSFSGNPEIWETDILLSSLSQTEILKPCLDIVIENMISKRMKIMEFGAPASAMYKRIIPFLNTQPMINIDYSVNDIEEAFEQADLDLYGLSSTEWNPKQISADTPPQNLIVLKNLLHKHVDPAEYLSNVIAVLDKNGFLLIQEVTKNFQIMKALNGETNALTLLSEDEWENIFHDNKLNIVCKKSDGFLCTLYLLRKPECDVYKQNVVFVDDLSCEWVEGLKNHLQKCLKTEENTWLVSHSNVNGIMGMVNCLRQEPGGNQIRCVFNASLEKPNDFPSIYEESDEFQRLISTDLVMNVYRDGEWGSFRHVPFSEDCEYVETDHAYVNVTTRGDLSSLQWIESPLKYHDKFGNPDTELCDVYYTSLNFRDVMLATGKLPPDALPGDLATEDCILGMEFAGRDQSGKRIMGMVPAKGLATHVNIEKSFLWEIPEDWTMEEAASIPVVYSTVYYALVVRGRIKKGDKVLIHSGSGGVGQAAIAVALQYGCEVFTTVGSSEKRLYLQSRFPQLQENNFANSRDVSFEFDILKATEGKGVDVILNSLADEKLQASLRILAKHGCFLEIGKYDLSNNSTLGMAVFLKNISFHGILLDALMEKDSQAWNAVKQLVSEGIKTGAVRPLKTTVFDKDNIEGAFRFMAQGKHIGKVVVKIREEENPAIIRQSVKVQAVTNTTCRHDRTYIITGGLGGFGLELCQWLIDRGAKHVVLTSRSGIKNGYQARKLRTWKKKGINVIISKRDIKSLQETELLVDEAKNIAAVGGIFHLAMVHRISARHTGRGAGKLPWTTASQKVLKDGLMENQTTQNFQEVCEPKVAGTINIDRVTRESCKASLQWFVVFSSVSCGRGNAGQANYGFANSVMERICEQRKRDGIPGLAIQWGAIGDVGIVLESMGDNYTEIGGTLPQRISSCLNTLDRFLNQRHPVMSSFVLAEKPKGNKSGSSLKTDIVEDICRILGVNDQSSLNPDTILADLGLDSLNGVEVQQMLERNHYIVLSTSEVRQLTINKLKTMKDVKTHISVTGDIQNTSESLLSHHVLDDSGVSVHLDHALIPMDTMVLMNAGKENSRPLFLVHSIEGFTTCLEDVAVGLDCPVYGIQCTVDTPLNSIQEQAAFYIENIMEIQSAGPYRLGGYSFGSTVALEIAIQLTSKGIPVESLHFLDGSHKFVSIHTSTYRRKLRSDSEEESEAMCAFVKQFMHIEYNKLFAEMVSERDYPSRLKYVSTLLSSTMTFQNSENLEKAANMFYQMLKIASKYKPESKYSGSVILIRVKERTKESLELGHDYGLSEICEGDIKVHEVDGDHQTFLQEDRVKNVIKIMNETIPQNV